MNDIEYRFRELEIELEHLKVAFTRLQEKYEYMCNAVNELVDSDGFYLDEDDE